MTTLFLRFASLIVTKHDINIFHFLQTLHDSTVAPLHLGITSGVSLGNGLGTGCLIKQISSFCSFDTLEGAITLSSSTAYTIHNTR
jgi:hypothetical protein